MKGLRTKDSKEFIRFFENVQKKANIKGFTFFLDFGECKDIKFNDMIIDDLFGWLIPNDKADDFEKQFLNRSIDNVWHKYCTWVIPDVIDNKLIIKFE